MTNDWNEIKTAATVARLGTISAAAAALGVHRATVTRHIDALEGSLGAKLFQRHARGFTPTELGTTLLRVADATQTQFNELSRIARGASADLDGEIVVTCLDVLVPFVLPRVAPVQDEHPGLSLCLITSDRVLKLEYGEADMAFRIGPKPAHPDNVVLRIMDLQMGLYASTAYETEFGLPSAVAEFGAHRFVGADGSAPITPSLDWLAQSVAEERITVRSNAIGTMWDAVRCGLGIGFHPVATAEPAGLHPVLEPDPAWHEPVWAVTHMDLHRTAKVQALVQAIRSSNR